MAKNQAKQAVDAAKLFGFTPQFDVEGYEPGLEHVPAIDPSYIFAQGLTAGLLSALQYNRRILIYGLHGTGKSSHVEQVAARLNWPLLRLNLDSQITRLDLVGRDRITLQDGQQVLEFEYGLLPWAMQQPMILVLDEYDAARPDVLFILQQLLEQNGKLVLPETNQVIEPHPGFRLVATANTAGLGDSSGLYSGTNVLNQGQLDRWQLVVQADFLTEAEEVAWVHAKTKAANLNIAKDTIQQMVTFATLTRRAFIAQDLSVLLSPRTLLAWAENQAILADPSLAFAVSYYNRLESTEQPLAAEYYQRCFGHEFAAAA